MKRQRGREKKKLFKKKVVISDGLSECELYQCTNREERVQRRTNTIKALLVSFILSVALLFCLSVSDNDIRTREPGELSAGSVCVCIMQRHTLHGTQAGCILKCFCGDKTCAIEVFNFQPRGPKNILLLM